jgi:glucosamine 6-phosphate synthetase-like amidotransferase/phosphosugar isomerase protein
VTASPSGRRFNPVIDVTAGNSAKQLNGIGDVDKPRNLAKSVTVE